MKALIMCVAAAVIACTAGVTETESFIAANERVNKVQALVAGDSVLAAVSCKPMFLASERRAFIAGLETELKREFGFSEAIVTMDVDLYYDISNVNAALRRGEKPEKRIDFLFSVARERRRFSDYKLD